MKKITPEMVRHRIAGLGLKYNQVYQALGLSRSWFYKMIMENEKYKFQEPNPEWMKMIMDYCADYERLKYSWKKK